LENKLSYNFSADFIRVIAIFGVVTIHIADAIYPRLDFFGGKIWWISIILDSLCRVSIPLFIMLSGYFILNKNESLQKSLKRAFWRIFIPFIAAVIFYSWWRYGKPSIGEINFSILSKIFFVNVYDFYFLVILLWLYAIAPFIRAYLQKSSPKDQSFLMKALLILGCTQVLFQYLLGSCTSNFFTQWIPYTGLFIAGYILGNKNKFNIIKLSAAYLFSFGVTLGFNYLYYYLAVHHFNFMSPRGCLSQYFDNYLSVNVVIMSISAFLLLLHAKFDKLKNNVIVSKVVYSIARAVFGIYIVHLAVARFLEMQFHLAIDFTSLPILLFLPVRLFSVFILSYLLVLILSKIPLVRQIVGYR